MAESRKRTSAKKDNAGKKERAIITLPDDFKIVRTHEFDNGNVSFDLEMFGITFYRLTVVETKDGKNQFISYPQYQSNGKWYNYFYIPLDDEAVDKIIEAVYDNLQDD